MVCVNMMCKSLVESQNYRYFHKKTVKSIIDKIEKDRIGYLVK